MMSVSEKTEPRSPQIERVFALPDGTVLQAQLMPVGVDFVHLSVSVSTVTTALSELCRPAYRPHKRRLYGQSQRDGFTFTLCGPPGQRNPPKMRLSLQFNPNTLNHFDSQSGQTKVHGDNTLAYNPAALRNALGRADEHMRSLGVEQSILDYDVTGVDLTRDLLCLHPTSASQHSYLALRPEQQTVADTMVGSALKLLSWPSPPYLKKRNDYTNKRPRSDTDEELEGLDRSNKSQFWSLYDKTLERGQKEAELSEGEVGAVDFMSCSGRLLRLEWRLRNPRKVRELKIFSARQLLRWLSSNSNSPPLDAIFDNKLRRDFLRSCEPYSRQLPTLDANWIATLKGLSRAQSKAFELLTQSPPRNLSLAQRERHKQDKREAVDTVVAWLDEQGSQKVFASLQAAYLHRTIERITTRPELS